MTRSGLTVKLKASRRTSVRFQSSLNRCGLSVTTVNHRLSNVSDSDMILSLTSYETYWVLIGAHLNLIRSGDDSVALRIIALFPQLLGSRSRQRKYLAGPQPSRQVIV